MRQFAMPAVALALAVTLSGCEAGPDGRLTGVPLSQVPAPDGGIVAVRDAPPGGAGAAGAEIDTAPDADAAPAAVETAEAAPVPGAATGAPATSEAWRRRLSPAILYINMGDAPVPVYSSATGGSPAGALARGEGGMIETCLDSAAICRIDTGDGAPVWVDVTRLSGLAG